MVTIQHYTNGEWIMGDQYIYLNGAWEPVEAGTPAIPDSVVYDFETGDTSRWTAVNDLSAVTSTVYDGTYSGHTDNAQNGTYQAYVVPDGYEEGAQPSKFEYVWRETESNSGAGFRLLNSNGDVETGVATQNPQWYVESDETTNVYDPGDYQDWTRFTITFDWENGEISVDFEDLADGDTYTQGGIPMYHGVDIKRVQLDTISSSTWQSGSVAFWLDNVTLEA